MKLSELKQMPEYYDRYINKCDDVDITEAIQISIDELEKIDLEKWSAIGDKTYAEGKWTIKDILQHLIDTERIFAYRALAFARGDTQQLPYFVEDDYASSSGANRRTVKDLIAEMKISHQSLKMLYISFTPEMLEKTGKGFKGEYSVASIGFVLPGHQRWHFGVIDEKYSNL